MGQWHQVFLIVRIPIPPTPPTSAVAVQADLGNEVSENDNPCSGTNTQHEKETLEVQAVEEPPFEYIPVLCIEHPWMYGMGACRRLYNILNAISAPEHRRAVIAEIKHVRSIHIDDTLESKVTPCPYISSLCYVHASFSPEASTASRLCVERHDVRLSQLWNDNGVTAIDITDPDKLRYAYFDMKPEGMECCDRMPFMTPLSAERYLSGHAVKDVAAEERLLERLERFGVLEKFTLDSAFPGWFSEKYLTKYDDDEILRETPDEERDKRHFEEFWNLEKPEPREENPIPTLHALAAKKTLLQACADEDSQSWLKVAIHGAPTSLPIFRKLLDSGNEFSAELFSTFGFGRLLPELIQQLSSEPKTNRKKVLDLTPYPISGSNITEFLNCLAENSALRSAQTVDLSGLENLTDDHLSLLPGAFPDVKTLYMLNNPLITSSGLSKMLSAYTNLPGRSYPPRLVASPLAVSFFQQPNSDFGAFRHATNAEVKKEIPDPDEVLKPSTPYPGFTTQIIWKVCGYGDADTCHASFLHPVDLLIGLRNFVAAYAEREGELYNSVYSGATITGVFGSRIGSHIPEYDYGPFRPNTQSEDYDWLYDGISPFVRQRTDHPQYNMDNMDNALGAGEWRLYIRTRDVKVDEGDREKQDILKLTIDQTNRLNYLDYDKVSRRVSFAFFRISETAKNDKSNLSQTATAKDAIGEAVLPKVEELTDEQKKNMTAQEILEHKVAQLTKLTNALECRNEEVEEEIKARKRVLRLQEKLRNELVPSRYRKHHKKEEGKGSARVMDYHTLREFIDITLKDAMSNDQRDAIYRSITEYQPKPASTYPENTPGVLLRYRGDFIYEELEALSEDLQSDDEGQGK